MILKYTTKQKEFQEQQNQWGEYPKSYVFLSQFCHVW